jgi:glycosyltransferase involved in cell wall biosynthesis
MKLFIQIPCFNESEVLLKTLKEIPKKINGIDSIDIVIIDDGSTDNTIAVAKKFGTKHIIKHQSNYGLAKAFATGLNYCLKHNADIIVNTDADNQYDASSIKDLITPILKNNSDIVIGARPIDQIENFSKLKKIMQKVGSWFVRIISRTDVIDAPSGFRAFSRNAAKKLIVFNEYTYTLETIIQAGYKNIKISSVPIKTNLVHRKSRLVKSIPSYVRKSVITMIRVFATYKPFRFFTFISFILLLFGFLISLRFLYFYINGDGSGHIQSLILAAIFIILGFQNLIVAFQSDLISSNRKLLEDIREKIMDDEN